MTIAQDLLNRKERPAYVKFVREAIQDPVASRDRGMYVARDIDIACITPPYSRDVMKFEVKTWFEQMRTDVINGRMPEDWEQQYHAKYDAWKKGEELPLDGVPIKGWAVASPAQQETLLRMGILTVEDLAAVNDEGLRRIGMGGIDLKNKAVAWLQAAKDKGPLTQEVAAVKAENQRLETELVALRSKFDEVMAALRVQNPALAQSAVAPSMVDELPASVVPVSEKDRLVGDYRAKFGRAPHPNSTVETLRARLQD